MSLTDTDNKLLHDPGDDVGARPAVMNFQAERAALLYTQAPVALLTALAVAFLIAIGLWGVVDQGMLMLWVGLQSVQTLFRVGVVWFYRSASDTERRDPRWVHLYFTGTLISGVVWGCIGLFIGPDTPVAHQILIMMGLAGVLAGAISSYAVLMPVYIAFMAPAMLIAAQSMLMQANQSQHVTGLLFIVFAGALLVIARNYSNSVASTLALRTENLDLLERMSVSNRALQTEVQERKQAEEELKRDRRLFTRGPVTVFRWSIEDGWPIEYVSKTVSQFGYDADELMKNRTSFASLIYKTDLQHVKEAEFNSNDQGLVALDIDYRLVDAAGDIRWVYDYTIPVRDEHGRITHYAGYLLDITDRKQDEFELHREKDRAQTTLNSIGEVVITTDVNGQIEYMNTAAEQMTGWEAGIARGLSLAQVFSLFDAESRQNIEAPVMQALREGRAVRSAQDCMLQKNGAAGYSIQYSISPLLNADNDAIGVVIVMHDVTENRSMARQLDYQTTHDQLTGLLNRREFEVRLTHALVMAKSDNEHHVLCHLDVDQFKIINDACCHEAGDNLLRSIAGLLPGYLRESDALARLGSDEFGILLKNCSLEDAAGIAGNILSEIHGMHFDAGGSTFDITASIGIAPIDAQSQNITGVMGAADLACYVAKENGRNRIHVYESSDQDLMRRHSEMRWVSRITEAIEKDRFVLYSQDIRPVVPGADDGQHFEILVRMLGDDGEIVTPDRFLPAAERYNLIGQLDRWVIRNSFDWYAANCTECCDGDPVTMAINLSGASAADESLLDYIKSELERTGVPPMAVCFEVTETAAIENLEAAKHFISDLQNMGCRFALDDFGSGLSSFAYLKTLPVDYLKIDGSFVRDIVTDPVDHAMVSSMNQLGRAMGIRTIAEFVENDEILGKLAEIGVDFAQGYGIARPCPLSDRHPCARKTA
jgi:diguanylate cyclase (GGDEF)-like protein/PAS domain S-box-containing protein